jgi:hypothetical protein
LLTAAQQASHGQRFAVDGSEFELHQPPPRHYERDRPSLLRARIITSASDLPLIRVNRHGLIDITAAESNGFWAWAVIEMALEVSTSTACRSVLTPPGPGGHPSVGGS